MRNMCWKMGWRWYYMRISRIRSYRWLFSIMWDRQKKSQERRALHIFLNICCFSVRNISAEMLFSKKFRNWAEHAMEVLLWMEPIIMKRFPGMPLKKCCGWSRTGWVFLSIRSLRPAWKGRSM